MASFEDFSKAIAGNQQYPLSEFHRDLGSLQGNTPIVNIKDEPQKVEVKPEVKEVCTHMETGESEKDDSDSDFDVKEELDKKTDTEDSGSEDSDFEDDIYKTEIDEDKRNVLKRSKTILHKKANYRTLTVQNYNSKTMKEDPWDNIKEIFKESPLEFERQKYHQDIFEKITETTKSVTIKDLENQYLKHLQQAAKIEVFSCALCSYQTMNFLNLKCHLIMFHKGHMERKVFRCDTCPYETYKEASVVTHLSVHNIPVKEKIKKPKIEKKYPCTELECSFEGRTEEGLQRHLKTRHTDRSHCDLCSFKSQDCNVLKEHKDTHKVGHKFHCYKCEYKNNCKTTLALHLVNIHKIENEASKRAKICEICSSAFSNTPLLLRHYISHKSINEMSENELFKCPHCDYQAKYKTALNSHMVIHKAPEFICEFCGFATKHKKNYKDHLVTHKKLDEIDWFRCDICPYQARNKKLLAKHIRKGDHSGKRLLHVRNRDRLREAEEKGEDINLVIKKYRIRKINGVKVKTERMKKEIKNPKRKKKPKKKPLKLENDMLEEENNFPGSSNNPNPGLQLFGFMPSIM